MFDQKKPIKFMYELSFRSLINGNVSSHKLRDEARCDFFSHISSNCKYQHPFILTKTVSTYIFFTYIKISS